MRFSLVLVEHLPLDIGPELVERRSNSALGRYRQGPLKGQARASVGLRVIEVGNSAGGQIPQHVGIIELPVAVIPFAADTTRYGIQQARSKAAGAFAEVARVLMKEDGKERIAKHRSVEAVDVGGRKPLRVSLRTLAVSGKVVIGLAYACIDSRCYE